MTIPLVWSSLKSTERDSPAPTSGLTAVSPESAAIGSLARVGVCCVALLVLALLPLRQPPAMEILERQPARYPEGLVRIDGAFWYTEMAANRITEWRRRETRQFSIGEPCGPTAVEQFGKELVVLCHLGDSLLVVSRQGIVLHRQSRSNAGDALYHPNDAVRDDAGGVYFSSSGDFKPNTRARGSVFYLHADGRIERVADRIHYANGVEFDPENQRLLVSEHLAQRVLAYPILEPGKLGPVTVLHDLRKYVAHVQDWMVGPDGLHLASDGTLRVALYGMGQILEFSSGRVAPLSTPMRYITTVLQDDDRGLVVGGTFDLADPQLLGQVIVTRPRANRH